MNTDDNEELALAWQFVEQTGINIFLTGKAGTGKTTFLRQLKEKSPKRMVVVAPTGVAAINAGGVTIHSFFQFPLAPYIPNTSFQGSSEKFRFSKEKKNIIRTLDLLVIDEVSMVRADLLDAIDAVLRLYKDHTKPFGGVQLLMIGDLQQLAPVVKDSDWNLLREYYHTPYFFGSLALQQTPHVTIELKHVYRQTDLSFVELLNQVRENQLTTEGLSLLNQRYIPNYEYHEGVIRLTTHNATANRFNEERMDALKGICFSFQAKVQGNFPETSYPADEVLRLKEGCQVMFLKNDSKGTRYYNGKLGIVTSVDAEHIRVRGLEDDLEVEVEPEVWTNAHYVLDNLSKEIREEIEGEFSQYPLRLAWAITVHKSQGLTFEKAVLDVNSAFAAGQVYVALSRLRSLEGLVLTQPLNKTSVITDQTVNRYMHHELEQTEQTAHCLDRLKCDYFRYLLTELFDFRMLEGDLHRFVRLLDEHLFMVYPQLLAQYKEAEANFKTKVVAVSGTFYVQYMGIIDKAEDYEHDTLLAERIHKAAIYFKDTLFELFQRLLLKSNVEIDNQDVAKRMNEAMYNMQQSYTQKRALLEEVEKEGFEVSSYLKNKAICLLNAEKDRGRSSVKRSKSPDKVAAMAMDDISNPRLASQLREWRREKAIDMGRPAYSILQQRSLIAIANDMPASADELLMIPGIGKRTLQLFGREILEIVDNYRENCLHFD